MTNDAYVPMDLSFSNGESGSCKISNKRMAIEAKVPGTVMVRRSDDKLKLDCKLEGGKTAVMSVRSKLGHKISLSEVFLDHGITDTITDKHRIYPETVVIPVE